MPNYSNLVTAFMEGKVQNRFIIISQALKTFIEVEAPIIEAVNIETTRTNKTPLESVKSKTMAEAIRIDIETAEKCLIVYNRTFGRIDHQLAMMGSNFNLPRFLADNGIPEEDINIFQRELEQYWGVTYQPLIDSFWTIKTKLDRLRQILQKEIELLQKISNAPYLDALNINEELTILFGQERNLFWDIVKDSQNITKNTKVIQGLFAAQKRQTKEAVLAYLRILKTNVRNEWQQSQGMTRAILCLTYFAGALNVYFNLRPMVIKQGFLGLSRLLQFLTQRKGVRNENEVLRIGERARDALQELAPNAIEKLLDAI